MTIDSYLDNYCARPATAEFQDLTILQFVERYRIPKRIGDGLVHRKKDVVVIVSPYCSPDPESPKYEHYCRQKVMVRQSFRQVDELLGETSIHLHTISFLGVVKFHPHLQMTFIDWNWKKERVAVLTLMKR